MEEQYITLAKMAAKQEAEDFIKTVIARADDLQVDREWFLGKVTRHLKKLIKEVG